MSECEEEEEEELQEEKEREAETVEEEEEEEEQDLFSSHPPSSHPPKYNTRGSEDAFNQHQQFVIVKVSKTGFYYDSQKPAYIHQNTAKKTANNHQKSP